MEYHEFVCSVLTSLCDAKHNLGNRNLNNYLLSQLTSCTPLSQMDIYVLVCLTNWSRVSQQLHRRSSQSQSLDCQTWISSFESEAASIRRCSLRSGQVITTLSSVPRPTHFLRKSTGTLGQLCMIYGLIIGLSVWWRENNRQLRCHRNVSLVNVHVALYTTSPAGQCTSYHWQMLDMGYLWELTQRPMWGWESREPALPTRRP